MPNGVRDFVRHHPLVAFVALGYLLTWIGWVPLAALHLPPTPLALAVYYVTKFGPAAAAVVVTWAAGDDVRAWAAQLVRWRVGARYWAVALLLPAAAMLVAGGIALVLTGVPLAPPTAHQVVYQSVAYPITVVLILLAGGGQEEPGWRGFALPRLQERYSALTASLVLGVVWVGWHLPLFAIVWSSQYGVSFPRWALLVLALSVVFTWVYNATNGSVLLVAVLHASINGAGIFFLAGGAAGFETALGYGLFAAVLTVVALALVVAYGPERLARGPIPVGAPAPE